MCYEPTATEIEQAAAEIRKKWTPEIEQERINGFSVRELIKIFANLVNQDLKSEQQRKRWRDRYARRCSGRGEAYRVKLRQRWFEYDERARNET